MRWPTQSYVTAKRDFAEMKKPWKVCQGFIDRDPHSKAFYLDKAYYYLINEKTNEMHSEQFYSRKKAEKLARELNHRETGK